MSVVCWYFAQFISCAGGVVCVEFILFLGSAPQCRKLATCGWATSSSVAFIARLLLLHFKGDPRHVESFKSI